MKLAQWARAYGVHPQTAYRWFREGTIPVPARRLPSGTIVVEQDPVAVVDGRTITYCRVSSHDQRDDLEHQAGRVSLWASEHGPSVDEVVTEVGSGLDAKRPRLARLLADTSVARIVVEHLGAAWRASVSSTSEPPCRPRVARSSSSTRARSTTISCAT